MSAPTLAEVFDLARSALGQHPSEVPSAEGFNDAILRPHVESAVQTLWKTANKYNIAKPERRAFFVLPQYAGTWVPSQSGVSNFESLLEVRSAAIDAQYSVSTFVPSTGVMTLGASHAFALGEQAHIYGVAGFTRGLINDAHRVTAIPGATQITLDCLGESGTYTSGGTCVRITGGFSVPWQRARNTDSLYAYASAPEYVWVNGQLRVAPNESDDRLLSIRYQISNTLPTQSEVEIGFDGALSFMAYYAAAMAADSLGAENASDRLLMKALGPDLRADASGGFLEEAIMTKLQEGQQVVHQTRSFRRPGGRSRRFL